MLSHQCFYFSQAPHPVSFDSHVPLETRETVLTLK